jgi:hypothetical protein
MVEFNAGTWRDAGRPAVDVPEEVASWMEHTYANRDQDVSCELPAAGSQDEINAFVRLLRIYAQRQDKRVRWQLFTRNGQTWIRFKMADKRSYTTTRGLPVKHR